MSLMLMPSYTPLNLTMSGRRWNASSAMMGSGERSPLPIIADEAFQRLPDIVRFKGVYDGINIKLMKSTGLYEAHKMVTLARALDMKVMIGCMTETSCAVTAAANLSPVVDYADLDGNLLIANDRFTGMTVENGKITLHDRPGLGIKLLK